jgi:hypothetical protein
MVLIGRCPAPLSSMRTQLQSAARGPPSWARPCQIRFSGDDPRTARVDYPMAQASFPPEFLRLRYSIFTIGLPSAPELRKYIFSACLYSMMGISPTIPEQITSLRSEVHQSTMVHLRRLSHQIALYLQASIATAQLPSIREPYDVVTYFCQRWYHQCTVSLLRAI